MPLEISTRMVTPWKRVWFRALQASLASRGSLYSIKANPEEVNRRMEAREVSGVLRQVKPPAPL